MFSLASLESGSFLHSNVPPLHTRSFDTHPDLNRDRATRTVRRRQKSVWCDYDIEALLAAGFGVKTRKRNRMLVRVKRHSQANDGYVTTVHKIQNQHVSECTQHLLLGRCWKMKIAQ